MSRVEDLVATRLAPHPLERIPGGWRHTAEQGTTDLVFRRFPRPVGAAALSAIASVQTRFVTGFPDFDARELARLNRRSVYGNFLHAEDGFGLKLSVSIFDREPGAEWLADLLTRALREQLALGIALAEAERSDGELQSGRARLDYPRDWTTRIAPEAFAAAAAQVKGELGHAAGATPDGVTLEIALADGAPSRMHAPETERALLRVDTGIRHPLAGTGYLGTIALPFDPPAEEIPAWCADLNAREHAQADFVPRLGAWGMRGLDDSLVYALFIPADQGSAAVQADIVNWLIQRTLWIKQTLWVTGFGLYRAMGR